MTVEGDITYRVQGKLAIIQLVSPRNLNACSFQHYQRIAKLLEQADEEPGTVVTLIISTGKFFSAGANISLNQSSFDAAFNNDDEKHEYWKSHFFANNAYLTKALYNHRKVLVAGLNGSAIGLSAAIVALSDLVYAKSEKFYLLFPFANLGLVTEAASGTTLFHRLGVSKTNEALLLSRPIRGGDLTRIGFVNRVYNVDSVDEFNTQLIRDLSGYVENLDTKSILQIKQLVQSNYKQQLSTTNMEEVILGLQRFENGDPQERFAGLRSGKYKHKL